MQKKSIMAFKTRTIRVPLFRPDPTAPFSRWSGRGLAPDEKAIILALEKQRFSRKPIRLLVNRDDRDADRVSALLADYLNFISSAKPLFAKPLSVKGYGPSERSERLYPASGASRVPGFPPLIIDTTKKRARQTARRVQGETLILSGRRPDSVRSQSTNRALVLNATAFPRYWKVNHLEEDYEYYDPEERSAYEWRERKDYYKTLYQALLPIIPDHESSLLVITGDRRKRSSFFREQFDAFAPVHLRPPRRKPRPKKKPEPKPNPVPEPVADPVAERAADAVAEFIKWTGGPSRYPDPLDLPSDFPSVKPPSAEPSSVKGYGPSERSERLTPASEASPGLEPLDEIFSFETLDLRHPPSPTPQVLYKTYNIPDFESESNPTRSSFFPLLIYSYRLEKPIEAFVA